MLLPTNKEEMHSRGWDEIDILLVSADAYVDHPSFAAALLSRLLEREGFRVGVIAQPDWRSAAAFLACGKPRLFTGISGGNIDSMLAHYTPYKNLRATDDYSPGGKTGLRPNRPTVVYAQRVREAFGKLPIVIGGIEASLRRFAHYDFWDDAVKKPILFDAKADLLVYGMGERQIVEIARRLQRGETIDALRDIRGTAFIAKDTAAFESQVEIPSFDDIVRDRERLIEATRLIHEECDPFNGRTVIQGCLGRYAVQLPPAAPLATAELDALYDLPFDRRAHPSYDAAGGVPALAPVQFSITSHRGCLGSCTFCSIAAHQGHIIQSRSADSILREVEKITRLTEFRGTISDIGGPTANMYMASCRKMAEHGRCRGKECVGAAICAALPCDHSAQLAMLARVRAHPKVKHVFLSTGVRFDLALRDKKSNFLEELCRHYVSGQLKVAPEHSVDRILELMRKPPNGVFDEFRKRFAEINRKLGKKQYLVTYLISSFPGSTTGDMAALERYMRELGFTPEQIQDFTPTPMTLATAMYYAERDLEDRPIHVARSASERKIQRAILQRTAPALRRRATGTHDAPGRSHPRPRTKRTGKP